jgi:molybdopterin-guanine dinucleotide biosynthesis protein A
MGQNKALMIYNGETMVEHTIKELKKVADEIVIASNNTNKYNLAGLTEVSDIYPGMGPLGGIHAGLLKSKNMYTFVVSCDMPFFSWKLASFLLEKREEYDVVVPEIGEYLEPLCAVYSKKCLGPIEKCLQLEIKKVIEFYPYVKVLRVNETEIRGLSGEAEKFFCNLNTPEDYHALLREKKQMQD